MAALPKDTTSTQETQSIAPDSAHSYGSVNERVNEKLEKCRECTTPRNSLGGQVAEFGSDAYDPHSLSTMKVFGIFNATVLQQPTLWKETGVCAAVFWSVFLFVLLGRSQSSAEGFAKAIGTESSIRAFLTMFSTLIILLLSFYTSLSLNRWWQTRAAINEITDACKELTMCISNGVTRDVVLLDTIQRYTRASLFLIFAVAQHKGGDAPPIRRALAEGLLNEEEVNKLEELCPSEAFVQSETLWVWLANVVMRLQKQGLTAGPPHYCKLMAIVASGQHGVSTIKTYLDTPIPLGYVHLLCFMVKLHNVLLNVLCAILAIEKCGGVDGFQPVGVFRTGFKAFFMPFLYNAILILNANVTDPFGGDPGDFEWEHFNTGIQMNSEVYAAAAKTVPSWLASAKFQAIQV